MTLVKEDFRSRLKDEIKQKQAVVDCLINKILYSKRLLIDHVDALEKCIASTMEIPPVRPHIFTARNTSFLVGGTIIEKFITPKSLRLTLIPSIIVASGFGVMYAIKKVFVFRNKIFERELESLIRAIDDFGNCIRRNMTYFNEIIVMKQSELIESRQIERAWDCITSAKEVTEILYDATRKLEQTYTIPVRFEQYYAPMEELKECDYFKNNVTDYSPKHIKDFHNIFAYVQSQFLLRLALTIATKPSISELNAELVKIDCLIRQLVQEEENHFKNLALELNKKKQIELDSLNESKAMQHRSGPIAVLQDSSLKLSGRMVAVAGECQALDITLQRLTETEAEHKDNAKQLIDVANSMRAIENTLSNCFDDFQRLILVYNKFLNNKILNEDAQHENADINNRTPDNDEYPESYLRVEISQRDNENQKDDFYAYMYDETQTKRDEQGAALEGKIDNKEMEVLNFEKRVTRVKFRPVLKQLKDRIDPIRKDMLEKEREVLAAKGINVDELFKPNSKSKEITKDLNKNEIEANAKVRFESSDSSDEGSADMEYEHSKKKLLKERDNFAEMRNFLAQKQAINLLGIQRPSMTEPPITVPPPPPVTGQEEILESEC